MLTASVEFNPEDSARAMQQLPARQRGVFALYGADPSAEPYVVATTDLRRRLERLMKPAATQTRRLQLVSRIRRIDWQPTGSEFESLAVQFRLTEEIYGARALERMHLRMPAFVRFHGSNRFPRITVTTRVNQREADWAFGPFPSRAAAERYAEEMLKLFLLRRCEENLAPDPAHPGCVYSEMKMCLAPCYQGCTDARYAEEASAVRSFLETRGASRLKILGQERDDASESLDFERAAALHTQFQRVESVRTLASELVHPLSRLRVCLLMPSARADEVSVFLFAEGALRGPEPFSTLGMRIQNEHSGSSSLFAQPVAVEAVPEQAGVATVPRDLLQQRLEAALAALSGQTTEQAEQARQAGQTGQPGQSSQAGQASSTRRQGDLALLARWYYRPQQKRLGEIFFAEALADGTLQWPAKAMLRGVGRVAAAELESRTGTAGE